MTSQFGKFGKNKLSVFGYAQSLPCIGFSSLQRAPNSSQLQSYPAMYCVDTFLCSLSCLFGQSLVATFAEVVQTQYGHIPLPGCIDPPASPSILHPRVFGAEGKLQLATPGSRNARELQPWRWHLVSGKKSQGMDASASHPSGYNSMRHSLFFLRGLDNQAFFARNGSLPEISLPQIFHLPSLTPLFLFPRLPFQIIHVHPSPGHSPWFGGNAGEHLLDSAFRELSHFAVSPS